MNSESILRLGRSPSDDESNPPRENPSAVNAAKRPEKLLDPSTFSCDGYEIHEDTPDWCSRPGTATVEDAASSSLSYAAMNPDFDVTQLPVERQFDVIEKEFATVESRTMNPRQYNFTTSLAFPTKNRYINVMANEETLFPPPRSPRATRSSAQVTAAAAATTTTMRNAGQRILDTLRGSLSSTSGSAGMCDDVAGFKTNNVTPSSKNAPLYFNGNVVDMSVEPVFVASQAPVLDCMEDFLNAMYNYKIPLILMLTEVEEAGFVKADRYWPADKGSGVAGEIFGGMAVYKDLSDPYHLDAKHELIFRPFFIRPCNVPKEEAHKVTMVQYVGWPDRGVPESTESFDELLRIITDQSAKSKASSGTGGSSNPSVSTPSSSNSVSSRGGTPSVLVHCSAGIGRTGTLIGAYTAIKLMEIGKLNRDSLRGILTGMRKARFGMVQRVEQYMFLYLIILQRFGADTTQFIARMQPRADLYNYRWMEARQSAMAATRAKQQQQQQP
jgi:protein tyrosine phosphatase